MRKHGHRGSRTYGSWRAMRKRCLCATNKDFKFYGGRGITICEQWSGIYGFITFLKDMGERPDGKSLDRIDTNGHYEPKNCRWATPSQQVLNQNPKGLLHSRAKKIEPGTRFGKLLCLGYAGLKPKFVGGIFHNHESYHEFRCDCGRTLEIRTRLIRNGNQSCGLCPRKYRKRKLSVA